jgi:plasminogen activator inhibitor 1 RNA-binding protein
MMELARHVAPVDVEVARARSADMDQSSTARIATPAIQERELGIYLLDYSLKLTHDSNSEKQEAHGWGATEGKAELADEIAGEAIAKTDEKDALVGDATKADEAVLTNETEPEPEDNSISYADYLVQLAEKKLALNAAVPEVRKPNEGTKDDKKWANAKALTKEEEEEFIAGSGGKAKRERERKAKNVIEIDQRFVEAPERTSRDSARGGRGGRGDRGDRGDGPRRGGPTNRGPRGDGNFRGPRGDGAPRGRGGPRGGAARGAPRGGAAPINTADKNAFPSLGSA